MDNVELYINVHTHKSQKSNIIAIQNIEFKGNLQEIKQKLQSHKADDPYFSVGIHPWFMDNWRDMLSSLNEIAQNKSIIAIGECGLDKKTTTPIPEQIELFKCQIAIAEKLQKPVIIHCVKAFNEVLEIRKSSKVSMPWIIHGFTENLIVALQCIKAGMLLSFGKSLFDARSNSYSVVNSVSTKNIFLETDDSSYAIEDIYNKCAEITGISVEQLKSDIATNFHRCFQVGKFT